MLARRIGAAPLEKGNPKLLQKAHDFACGREHYPQTNAGVCPAL